MSCQLVLWPPLSRKSPPGDTERHVSSAPPQLPLATALYPSQTYLTLTCPELLLRIGTAKSPEWKAHTVSVNGQLPSSQDYHSYYSWDFSQQS